MRYQNYTVVGDVIALILCIAFLLIIRSMYLVKNRQTNLLRSSIALLFLASLFNIVYYEQVQRLPNVSHVLLYILRDAHYLLLMSTSALYVEYFYMIITSRRAAQLYKYLYFFLTTVFAVMFVISPLTHLGFYITPDHVLQDSMSSGWFSMSYLAFILIIVILLGMNRKYISKKIRHSEYAAFFLAFLIMFVQSGFDSTSYTTFTFLLPMFVSMVLFHNSSLDIETGCLNNDAFHSYFQDNCAKNQSFCLITFKVLHYNHEMSQDTDSLLMLRNHICHSFEELFAHVFLFQRKHNIFSIAVKHIPLSKVETRLMKIQQIFKNTDSSFQLSYKMIVYQAPKDIASLSSIKEFEEFLFTKMSPNDMYICSDADRAAFHSSNYIKQQLRSIGTEHNLDDPRVLVFCQPILNTQKKKYSTAESLMRLELPELGLVYPDQFIPLAEEFDLLHPLSLIMLSKVCKQINRFLADGYTIDRVSINFSAAEMIEPDFVSEISNIIDKNQTPYDKIAIEITESTFTDNFHKISETIEILRKKGITFYLDDFGTGYSNFSRISMYPFDVIKFDRSLLLSVENNEKTAYMIGQLSAMFSKIGFRILFEGIETLENETLCEELGFDYLQGYRYSRPIPMQELKEYLLPDQTQSANNGVE